MLLEQTIKDEELKYISYGNDRRFFQIKGNDLYYNTGTVNEPKYSLLAKNYNKVKL